MSIRQIQRLLGLTLTTAMGLQILACGGGSSSSAPASSPQPTTTSTLQTQPQQPISNWQQTPPAPQQQLNQPSPYPSSSPTQTLVPPPDWNQPPPVDSQADFDIDGALQDRGEWIYIEYGGQRQRYFRPHFETVDNDWRPYLHGYWSFDADRGWTWVSWDPWGEVTEHYGIWRHHATYGWIWLPFEERVYHPHCVTWFDDGGDYVGWYPYFGDYKQGYAWGQAVGFDDGYWDSMRIAAQANDGHFAFSFGFTMVSHQYVTSENIFDHRVTDNAFVLRVAARVHSDQNLRLRIGDYPGGNKGNAYAFLQGKTSIHAPVTRLQLEVTPDGHHILGEHSNRKAPTDERQRLANFDRSGDHNGRNNDGGKKPKGLQPQVQPPKPNLVVQSPPKADPPKIDAPKADDHRRDHNRDIKPAVQQPAAQVKPQPEPAEKPPVKQQTPLTQAQAQQTPPASQTVKTESPAPAADNNKDKRKGNPPPTAAAKDDKGGDKQSRQVQQQQSRKGDQKPRTSKKPVVH